MLIRCEFVEEEKGKNERNICQENNWREEGEGRGDWRLQTAREGVKTQTDIMEFNPKALGTFQHSELIAIYSLI